MRAAPFRILLYAHVDLNVVDGSAFFVAGAASLLTSAPGVEVDVVTATPIQRAVVVHEMLANPAVTVVDPFRDERLALRRPEFRQISRMDEATAGSMLVHYLDRGGYDIVLVRSSEVAAAVARLRPDLGSRLCVYVTGVVSAGSPVGAPVLGTLRRLARCGATLLCQTEEMSDRVVRLLGETAGPGSVAVMRPSVPAGPPVAAPAPDGPLVAAYTGKFARAWNTVEMVAGFKQAVSRTPSMRLLVAGDHFRAEPDWPTFAAEARYLFGSHPQITWVGGVTRAEARDLVAAADVGLGWRAASLDDSLELSTKILENGSLGRPSIINPTAMHRRMFGSDYPLFASSMADFVALLERVAVDRSPLLEAAERTAAVAADHSYERVFDDLFPTLVRAAAGSPDDGRSLRADVLGLVSSGRRVHVRDGWVTAWLARASDAADLREVAVEHRPAGPVERSGPFVRWRAAGGGDGSLGTNDELQLVLDTFTPAAADDGRGSGGADCVVMHDRGGRVRLGPPVPSPQASGAPQEAEQRSERLAEDLQRQTAEAHRLRRQYAALSSSLLGRTQLRYWRLRARLRRSASGAG